MIMVEWIVYMGDYICMDLIQLKLGWLSVELTVTI